MKNRTALTQITYLILMVVGVIMFFVIGSKDVLDVTNNKGYVQFTNGDQIELKYFGSYVDKKMKGVDTEDTIARSVDEQVEYIIGTNVKIVEISGETNNYKVEIYISNNPLNGSNKAYLYFDKTEKNEILKNMSGGDKISFKATTVNKISIDKYDDFNFVVLTNVELTNKEDK